MLVPVARIPTYARRAQTYAAGCFWDALRPIRDRFIGNVLRAGLAGVAIYGAFAVTLPVLDDKPTPLKQSLNIVALVSGIWAVFGAGAWMKDRLWGGLAKR